MAGFDKVKRKLEDVNGKVLFLDVDWVEVEHEKFYFDDEQEAYAKRLWNYYFEEKDCLTWRGNKYTFSYTTPRNEYEGVCLVEGVQIPTWRVVGEGLKNLPEVGRDVIVKGFSEYFLPVHCGQYVLLGNTTPFWDLDSGGWDVEESDEWIYIEDLMNLPVEGGSE